MTINCPTCGTSIVDNGSVTIFVSSLLELADLVWNGKIRMNNGLAIDAEYNKDGIYNEEFGIETITFTCIKGCLEGNEDDINDYGYSESYKTPEGKARVSAMNKRLDRMMFLDLEPQTREQRENDAKNATAIQG